MSSFCKVILMGYLARDPELRYTPKGSAVASLCVATNRAWQTELGEKKTEVCFTDVTAWAGRAEAISKFLRKGDPILVEGYLAQEQWEDKATGQKRSKLKVVLESFSFVGTKQRDAGDESAEDMRPPAPRSGGEAPQKKTPAYAQEPDSEDHIPF